MASVTPERGLALVGGLPGRRGLRITAYAVVLVVLLGAAAWLATHPKSLPTTTTRVVASTPVGQPVFVGVFAATAGFDRTLEVSGVRVYATSTADVTIVPHLCRGGSISVTTTPKSFCTALVPTEGATLRAGDEIVLEVSGETPASVEVDRVRIAFRDGLSRGVSDAGAPAQVTILPR